MSKKNSAVQTATQTATQPEQTRSNNFTVDSRTRGQLEAMDGSIDLIAVRSGQDQNGLVEAQYLTGPRKGEKVTLLAAEVKPISGKPGSAGDSPFGDLLTPEEKEEGMSVLNLARRLAGDERPQGGGTRVRYLNARIGDSNLFLSVEECCGELIVKVQVLSERPDCLPKFPEFKELEKGGLSAVQVKVDGRTKTLITTRKRLVIKQ